MLPAAEGVQISVRLKSGCETLFLNGEGDGGDESSALLLMVKQIQYNTVSEDTFVLYLFSNIVFSEKPGTIRKKIVLADPGRSHALDIKLGFYRFGFGQVCDPNQDLTLQSSLSFFLRRDLTKLSSYLESGCKVYPDPTLYPAIPCYIQPGWEGS
jgi:hypothetical protein